jgi:hypothetical protein
LSQSELEDDVWMVCIKADAVWEDRVRLAANLADQLDQP